MGLSLAKDKFDHVGSILPMKAFQAAIYVAFWTPLLTVAGLPAQSIWSAADFLTISLITVSKFRPILSPHLTGFIKLPSY